MRVISCSLNNFGSYKELVFDFTNQSLTLLQGPTGSGKSTLCDAIPWILFGRTAKNGAVDEILKWPKDEVTVGKAIVDINGKEITITRKRGTKPKDNDLYWFVISEQEVLRGKDIPDTQKLINSMLGIDIELYLSGAYFHEFSQTAQFFTTTAKNRRMICEQIVDLSLAKKLQEKLSEKEKENKKEILLLSSKIETITSNIKLLEKMQKAEITKSDDWLANHNRTIKYVTLNYDKFEANRDKVITGKCSECGTKLKEDIHKHDDSVNPYLSQLNALKKTKNPHTGGVKDYTDEIEKKLKELEQHVNKENELTKKSNNYSILTDVVIAFRSSIINNMINYVETTTNDLLNRYFDAEIKINLLVENDKIDISIEKDSNNCVYTQLSKGQRQLLRLCFGVAIMQAVQNHSGVKFTQVFFDEALDGLDEALKIKAYNLLDSLATTYESVFVVEHSEGLKALFNNCYSVELTGGDSKICRV